MRKPAKSFWGMVVGLAVLLVIGLLFPPLDHSLSGDGTDGEEREWTPYHALGVFRVFAVDALWMRMRTHKEEGRDGLVLADARAILKLEPDCDRIRDFLHWHLAFNMARRATDAVPSAPRCSRPRGFAR